MNFYKYFLSSKSKTQTNVLKNSDVANKPKTNSKTKLSKKRNPNAITTNELSNQPNDIINIKNCSAKEKKSQQPFENMITYKHYCQRNLASARNPNFKPLIRTGPQFDFKDPDFFDRQYLQEVRQSLIRIRFYYIP